ncbi:MAG: hypothetical protein AABY78_08005 [Nitrospirota bacterium]
MFNFSYFDGFNTTSTLDDNMCTSTGSPCTGFPTPGTYPTYKYYGYFNPDYWYTYSSSRFVPSAPKLGSGLSGERTKLSTEWDGNFLNWVTMRRVDVIRKIMTGGKTTTGEGAGYNRLVGEKADCNSRGRYKRITDATPYTPYSGTKTFTVNTAGGSCNGSGSGTPNFSVSGVSGTFNVAVRVPEPVEGVLQSVVGANARLGLSFYNINAPRPQGGLVRVTVSGGSLSSTVNEINLTRPNSNTPLGETLWTMAGYFAQQASIAGGPGPRYNSGDFQINNNVDPYNYGTGGQPVYRSCAKSFVLYITDGEPCADGYLPSTIADYASGRSQYNCTGGSCPAVSPFTASTFPSCTAGGYVAGIEDVALWAHTTDLRNSPTLGVNNISGTQNLTLYTVFAFGGGSTLLKYAAINGGFEDLNSNNIPDLQSEWDNNSDNVPDTYYEATDGDKLEQAIKNAFLSILKRASSGTAASVLASGEGQGSNIIQSIFYPRRRFGNDIISWTGSLQNLWFYVDPFFQNSNIREDTLQESPSRKLNLIDDYIAQLYFDTNTQTTRVRRYQDTDGDGDADTAQSTVDIENIGNIWEAGNILWSRNISTDPRTVYTNCDITGGSCIGTTKLMSFSQGNASTFASYLQATDVNGNGSNVDESQNIIRYIHGEDITLDANGDGINDYRKRTATIGASTYVWKLSDILNSTPRISSWVQLNTYDTKYKYNDTTYGSFISSSGYKNRGMVFTGANDGMLHAFKLGKLELPGQTGTTCSFGTYDKACLSNPSGYLGGSSVVLGKEMWSFIPKNALPYLKYISDPNYCHLYTVDLSPYIFDASINGNPDDTKTENSWRTILIGGMRTGGACRGTTTTCTDVSGDGNKDCVNTPVDVSGSSVGFSSYFALDITDQSSPTLLWEFSHPQLGFATTGPAVVRISAKDNSGNADNSKNGYWFVVFGSGPTGPVSTADMQFMGRSDQNLRFFIFDLKNGPGVNNANVTVKDTTIPYAFAGSMLDATNDSDMDYQDDAVYIGYVKRTGTSPSYTWTEGGVGRLVTYEDQSPSSWQWRTVVDNIGPITSSITRLQKNRGCDTTTNAGSIEGCLWLYFGTGRYYYAQESGIDDQSGQRRLYGIKEPCIKSGSNPGTIEIDPACTTSASGFTNVSSIADVPSESTAKSASFKGWYINLDPSITGYGSERVITDPLSTTTGFVFFTTFQPYTDVCSIGGNTYIWAVRYSTGGAPGDLLKGVALLQVSTAAIEQVSLSEAFTEKEGRRTPPITGSVPPTSQGLSLLTTPPPVKRIIHMRER